MELFMEAAFVEARNALASNEVPVGCVFVYNGEIIARGGNDVNATKNATRHAEFVCLDKTLEYCKERALNWKHVLPEVSVVVTVEPCVMCASALYEIGVKEIIYGCANDRFGGKTVVDVGSVVGKKIDVIAGVRAEEAMELLKDFYKLSNPSAPVPKRRKQEQSTS